MTIPEAMTHHIFDLLHDALVHYGYWAVAAALLLENSGVPVPGETILLLASALAYGARELQLGWIIAVGTVAATLGDNLGYGLGLYGGRVLLERYRSFFRIGDAALIRGEKLFGHFGAFTILFARFVFGMRVIAGPLAGVLRMPWKIFVIFNFLGAVLWVTVISCAGYFFGSRWRVLMHFIARFDLILAVLFVLVILVLWWRGRTADVSEASG
jgi:membrane protein DedA with SNARE-associated domain